MMTPSDPLFWIIAFGLTLPWGVVTWIGFALDRKDKTLAALKADIATVSKQWSDATLALAAMGPPPLIDEGGGRVIPFEPRVIEGGANGGKYQRPRVVDVPLLGSINGNDSPGGTA